MPDPPRPVRSGRGTQVTNAFLCPPSLTPSPPKPTTTGAGGTATLAEMVDAAAPARLEQKENRRGQTARPAFEGALGYGICGHSGHRQSFGKSGGLCFGSHFQPQRPAKHTVLGFMRRSQTMSNPTKLTCVAVAFLAIAIAGAQFWEGRAIQEFCFTEDTSSCAGAPNFDFTALAIIR
jgi:hypothetical protein